MNAARVTASATAAATHPRGVRLLIGLLVAVIALLALKCAWVSDDAYITLRVVDNFVNGYGPRW